MRISNIIHALICTCGTAAGLALAGPLAPSPAAGPAPRFTLLTRDQPPLPISLISISDDAPGVPATITYLDPAASEKTIGLRDIIALAPASWVPTPETTAPPTDEYTTDLPIHRLDLTDGQRFTGEFQVLRSGTPSTPAASVSTNPSPNAADAPVVFLSERLGALTIPLDRVRRYASDVRRPPGLGGAPLSVVNDTLVLANSDRLEGLVTRLGAVVSIETKAAQPTSPGSKPAGSGAPASRSMITTIDARQVLLANLVNPPAPLRSLRVDLADGTVVATDRVAAQTQGSRLTIRALAAGNTAPTVAMDIGHLAAVIPDPSRIIPLCILPIAAQAGAAGRVSTAPAQVLPDVNAPLSAADILLPGPMTVDWAVPAGAATLVGYAQMDDRSFAWGDCTVTVYVCDASPGSAEREIARGRLNSESPSLTIAAPLGTLKPGDRLRVRVEPAERGPIQDRVVLRRMVFLSAPASN